MPKPPTDNPALRDSFSLRMEHVCMIAQIKEWRGGSRSEIVQRAIECLFSQEAAKRNPKPEE